LSVVAFALLFFFVYRPIRDAFETSRNADAAAAKLIESALTIRSADATKTIPPEGVEDLWRLSTQLEALEGALDEPRGTHRNVIVMAPGRRTHRDIIVPFLPRGD
jgi:hypothetical protein